MKDETSWEESERWYDATVGKEGHYYHQAIVIAGVLRLLALSDSSRLLDLACGQGVLARAIAPQVEYHGIDLSPSLIQSAKQRTKRPHCTFSVGDICKPLNLNRTFTHATIILALQNVADPKLAIEQVSKHLELNGTFVTVLNHPCFRIPRQSHWGIDEQKKLQFRQIDRYLTSLKIPIQTHPGKGKESETTWSFHHPLSSYASWLSTAGFLIEGIEEWASDKVSTGKNAARENRARTEFPLFLAIKAKKCQNSH